MVRSWSGTRVSEPPRRPTNRSIPPVTKVRQLSTSRHLLAFSGSTDGVVQIVDYANRISKNVLLFQRLYHKILELQNYVHNIF